MRPVQLPPSTANPDPPALPRLNAPIVMVHGLLGYHEFRVGNRELLSYFPGIVDNMRKAGNEVLVPLLLPTHGIADRAALLKSYIDGAIPGQPFHLIAHSMGGLDCRYAISKLGLGERVLSLTTVGTPHRGSAFADWGIGRLERLLRPVLQFLYIPHQAFYDLTTVQCAKFNDEVRDDPRVRYFSVAGQFEAGWLTPAWKLPHHIVRDHEGENDGIVSIASASYGEQTEVWEGDHFSLVNWKSPIAQAAWGNWQDRTPRYGELLSRLAAAGF